jgi:mono/diheme cytochrome c family protein
MTRILAAALVLWFLAEPASAFMAGNARAGGSVAAERCAACHPLPDDRGGTASPASDVPDFAAIAADEDTYTVRRIKDSIAGPHASGTVLRLSSNDLNNLIAFILSLRNE